MVLLFYIFGALVLALRPRTHLKLKSSMPEVVKDLLNYILLRCRCEVFIESKRESKWCVAPPILSFIYYKVRSFFQRNLIQGEGSGAAKTTLSSILSTKKLSEFWQNSQNSENFYRFSKCVLIKIFWGKFSENLSSQLHQKFYLKISQIFWKNWWVQNIQIFVRKFLRTQIFVDRTKPSVLSWCCLAVFDWISF